MKPILELGIYFIEQLKSKHIHKLDIFCKTTLIMDSELEKNLFNHLKWIT